MRAACLFLLTLIIAPALPAQTVVRPTPPLDSARAVLRDALLALRDSLNTIDGAASRLQRDFRQTSGPSLISRAKVMRDACARSVRTVPATRASVASAKLTDPKRVQTRRELIGALDHLKGVLSLCETEFAAMSQPDQAETVRGYANDRAVRIQGEIRKYEHSLRDFLTAMGIKVVPLGVTPGPAAG